MSYLATLKNLQTPPRHSVESVETHAEISETPSRASVESVETTREQDLDTLDTCSLRHSQKITGAEARRLWLVTLPTGERFSSSNTPPATLAEMRQRYPGATIEPEKDAGQ